MSMKVEDFIVQLPWLLELAKEVVDNALFEVQRPTRNEEN